MTPASAVAILHAYALNDAPATIGEAIAVLTDHVGSLERAISLTRDAHENFIRHVPDYAVHLVRPAPVVDSKPIARVPGKPERRKGWADRPANPQKPAPGNADGLYKHLSPRQRHVIAVHGPAHKDVCDLFAARAQAETDAVVEKCKLWLKYRPDLKDVRFETGPASLPVKGK